MQQLTPQDFSAPAILLGGPVDYAMYKEISVPSSTSP
jgi:hypothetical protein